MSMPSEGASGTYQGRLGDGRTASAMPSTVRFLPTCIEIAPGGGQAPVLWPYGELAAASPVGRRAGDVLLSCSAMPGATLFVADQGFVAELAARAPQLSAGSQRWRYARPLLAACAAAALLAAGLWLADVSPARGLAGLLPAELRQSFGRQVIQSLGQGRGTCHTPEGSDALRSLTERLSAAAGRRFSVSVLNWGIVNAFAAPGEQIVIARGLIEQARSPDEVAGVLAHEMGHGIELHPETGIIRAIGLSAATELMFGGSGGTIASIGLVLTQLGYSRVAEREADAHALTILEKAQISPQAFAEFFKRLDEGRGGSPLGQVSLFRSHPLSAERARLAASRPRYPALPALSDEEWQALRGICGRAEKP
jgi:Zn-dependent protease with chaperone function